MAPPLGGKRATAAIVLATHGARPAPTEDDALALVPLTEHCGARVHAMAWDAVDAAWDDYATVLIRSTWDYHRRLRDFLTWADRVEMAGAALWNPAAVVRWNADKGYLRALERAGVAVVPTEWIREADADLAAVLRHRGWRRAVVKPSVAATSFRTWLTDAESTGSNAERLSAILAEADALVQPFLPQVRREGEWSFVFFDGGDGRLAFSHAVVKRAAAEDFRVQTEFGGTVTARTPSADLLAQVVDVAATVSRLAPGPLLYARIDGVVGDGGHAPAGTFLLMEVELIEPKLFLAYADHAADRFAAAVARRLAVAAPAVG